MGFVDLSMESTGERETSHLQARLLLCTPLLSLCFSPVLAQALTHSSHLSQILAAMGPCVQLCCNFLPPYDSGSNMVIGERCQVIWYDIGIQVSSRVTFKPGLNDKFSQNIHHLRPDIKKYLPFSAFHTSA